MTIDRAVSAGLVAVLIVITLALTGWGPELGKEEVPRPAAAAVWLPTGTWSECRSARWTGTRYVADVWRWSYPRSRYVAVTVECPRTIYRRAW